MKYIKINMAIIFLTILLSNCANTLTNNKLITIHISDETYKYIFHIEDKILQKNNLKIKYKYYWYKSQEIHSSWGDYAGKLLTGGYSKFYKTNQLAEKGKFKHGKKDGKWIEWWPNGKIMRITIWKKGSKNGKYLFFDKEGKNLIKGTYKHNKRHALWIANNDSIYYKNGKRINKKESLFNKFFRKIFRLKKEKKK